MAGFRTRFDCLKQQGKKVFIPYLTYGFPDLVTFERMVLTLAQCGLDFLEIGLPFSDPIADGPLIQYSSQVALQNKVNLVGLLDSIRKLKKKTQISFILMSYYNPLFSFGLEKFAAAAKGLIDCLVVPDLLCEEAGLLLKACKKHDIDTAFFVAPTTDPKRFALIERSSSGFIYYISVTGTTGIRKKFASDIFAKISSLRKKIKVPLCVGFGISERKQALRFYRVADGVIVGSALVKFIKANYTKKNFPAELKKFIDSFLTCTK